MAISKENINQIRKIANTTSVLRGLLATGKPCSPSEEVRNFIVRVVHDSIAVSRLCGGEDDLESDWLYILCSNWYDIAVSLGLFEFCISDKKKFIDAVKMVIEQNGSISSAEGKQPCTEIKQQCSASETATDKPYNFADNLSQALSMLDSETSCPQQDKARAVPVTELFKRDAPINSKSQFVFHINETCTLQVGSFPCIAGTQSRISTSGSTVKRPIASLVNQWSDYNISRITEFDLACLQRLFIPPNSQSSTFLIDTADYLSPDIQRTSKQVIDNSMILYGEVAADALGRPVTITIRNTDRPNINLFSRIVIGEKYDTDSVISLYGEPTVASHKDNLLTFDFVCPYQGHALITVNAADDNRVQSVVIKDNNSDREQVAAILP